MAPTVMQCTSVQTLQWNIGPLWVHVHVIATLNPIICVILLLCLSFCHHPPLIYAGPTFTHDSQGHAVPKGECVYIRQSTGTCVITNMLHFWHSKICPNLKLTAQLAYIVTDADCDSGRYFNIFIMFSNISMMDPIQYLYFDYGIIQSLTSCLY